MLKTLIAVAVAGAFALPMAAQSSPAGDNLQIAQAGGAGGAAGGASGAAGGGAAGGAASGAAGAGGASGGTGAAAGGGAATGSGQGAASSGGDSNAGAPGGNAAMGFSDRRFNEWDKNHDGYVSRDEAKGVSDLDTRFSEMDKNNDGKISRDEMRSHGSAARGATSGVPVQQGGTMGEKGKQ